MNNPLLIVLALSLPSLLTAVVLAVLLIRRKALERGGVERLLAAVKSAEPSFRAALLQRLVNEFQCEEESAGQTADKLVKHRRQTYKQVLTALLDRDPGALVRLEPVITDFADVHLKALSALSLQAGKRESAPIAVPAGLIPQAPPIDAGEAVLRGENDRLRREVSLTLSTLNNIFAEYASMFGDEHTRRDMSLPEILSAMQHLAEGEQAVGPALDPSASNAPLSAMTEGSDGELSQSDVGVPGAEMADETTAETELDLSTDTMPVADGDEEKNKPD